MRTMRELPPMEVKDTCDECAGTGRKYFNSVEELTDYLMIKLVPQCDAILAIKQFAKEEDYIDCPECRGKGFKTYKL